MLAPHSPRPHTWRQRQRLVSRHRQDQLPEPFAGHLPSTGRYVILANPCPSPAQPE